MRAVRKAIAAAAGAALCAASAAPLPPGEMAMIREVALKTGLDAEQTYVLMAIRKIENGRPGLEFGIGGPVKNHPSRRYTDGVKSFKLQAEWAAGTVRKRYTGDMDAFARRYCPGNAKKWAAMARSLVSGYRKDPAVAKALAGIRGIKPERPAGTLPQTPHIPAFPPKQAAIPKPIPPAQGERQAESHKSIPPPRQGRWREATEGYDHPLGRRRLPLFPEPGHRFIRPAIGEADLSQL